MKHLFKAKRKKPLDPPPPLIAPGNTADTVVGPPHFLPGPGVASEGGYSPYQDCWKIALIRPYNKMRERVRVRRLCLWTG